MIKIRFRSVMSLLSRISSWLYPRPFPLESLPLDVFGDLLLLLDPVVLSHLMQTCSSQRDRIRNHSIWMIYYHRCFPNRPKLESPDTCRAELSRHWICSDLARRDRINVAYRTFKFESHTLSLLYDPDKEHLSCHVEGPRWSGSFGLWERDGWSIQHSRVKVTLGKNQTHLQEASFPIIYQKGRFGLCELYRLQLFTDH